MNLGLEGRRALVTGGSRGIGRECALSFARERATVCINYVSNEGAAEQTQQDLLALGVPAHSLRADVTNLRAARDLIEQAMLTMGGVDILVHSAGINLSSDEGMDEQEVWRRLIESHLHSTQYLCSAAARPMMDQGWGRIIVIGSIAGRCAGSSGYSVGKAAQSHYARGLAESLAPYNVTVNVVSPGRVNTDMIPGSKEDWVAFARANIPTYRCRNDFPGPELIGDVVAFLASEQARYISGADLPVCGASYTGL